MNKTERLEQVNEIFFENYAILERIFDDSENENVNHSQRIREENEARDLFLDFCEKFENSTGINPFRIYSKIPVTNFRSNFFDYTRQGSEFKGIDITTRVKRSKEFKFSCYFHKDMEWSVSDSGVSINLSKYRILGKEYKRKELILLAVMHAHLNIDLVLELKGSKDWEDMIDSVIELYNE